MRVYRIFHLTRNIEISRESLNLSKKYKRGYRIVQMTYFLASRMTGQISRSN